MSAPAWIALGLALTTTMAWVRLGLWARRTTAGARTSGWRLAVLLAAQPMLALLLYLTLFPPPAPAAQAGMLIVATRGAPRLAALAGGLRVDLPEAPSGLGGEPAPDLATALRRHPGVTRLRILGDGLEPRDREAAEGRSLSFTLPPPSAGLTALHPPGRVEPGEAFQVEGEVNGAAGGSAELLDPAGRVVDVQPLSSSGRFALTATAREAGPALFAVRTRDSRHAAIEVADVPVWTASDPGPMVLLLAGAPGPEVKQLRRWALDAGVTLQTSVGAGGGLELGEPRPKLDPADLGRLDLVVVDERSWPLLSSADRAAIIAATRSGMGLLLRITGPVPAAVREQWSALGLPLGSGDETTLVRLPPGAARADPSNTPTGPAAALPDLTRRVIDVPGADAPSLTQDAASTALGRWRALGRGRIGVWAVTDSSGLVTAGFADRYGELWSTLFARLSRPSLSAEPSSDGSSADTPRAGQRVSICRVGDGAEVLDPKDAATRLHVDPAAGAAGCAGYWPVDPGWRMVRIAKGAERLDRLFYVYPADALPGVHARELSEGTLRIAGASNATLRPGIETGPPGPAWPWLIMLLTVLAGVWYFERARYGRSGESG